MGFSAVKNVKRTQQSEKSLSVICSHKTNAIVIKAD